MWIWLLMDLRSRNIIQFPVELYEFLDWSSSKTVFHVGKLKLGRWKYLIPSLEISLASSQIGRPSPLPHVSVRGTLVQVTRRIPYFKRDQKSLSGGYEKNNCVTVEMDYEIIKRYFFMNNLLTKNFKMHNSKIKYCFII